MVLMFVREVNPITGHTLYKTQKDLVDIPETAFEDKEKASRMYDVIRARLKKDAPESNIEILKACNI